VAEICWRTAHVVDEVRNNMLYHVDGPRFRFRQKVGHTLYGMALKYSSTLRIIPGIPILQVLAVNLVRIPDPRSNHQFLRSKYHVRYVDNLTISKY
jgi:hypothetical protein